MSQISPHHLNLGCHFSLIGSFGTIDNVTFLVLWPSIRSLVCNVVSCFLRLLPKSLLGGVINMLTAQQLSNKRVVHDGEVRHDFEFPSNTNINSLKIIKSR